jgi:tetratricopeptide (TPR) repeat protein
MRDELPAGEIAGKVYQHLAEVALRRGQLKTQHDYLIRARGEFEESGDRQGLSDVLLELSGALMTPAPDAPSRLEEAADLLRRAQDLKRAIGDRTGVAQTFYRLGTLEIMRDHLDAAEGYLVQGLRMYQALRAQYYVAACHNAIGITKILKREFAEAEKHLKESSNLFDKMGDQIALSHTRLNEGCLEINRQDFTRAQTLLREARRLKESLGTTWALFDLRNHLTIVSLWLGDLDEARRMLETTLERVDTDGTLEDRAIAHSLRGLLQCFQSRLQIGALELQRGRADAEDLGLARVAAFCQANAAFYALLTEDEAGFENLFASFAEVDVLYTVDRAVWLELLERLALHIADREKSRQTVRLVRTAAKFWRAFNHDEQADALDERADEMRAQLEAKSADEEDDEAEDAEAGDEDSTPEPKATSGSSQTEDAG